jgi:hypothetical protein
MKRVATAVSAVALLLCVSGSAQAFDPCCGPCFTVQWVDKPVTCQRMEWRCREVPCEVMRPVCREEVRVCQRDVLVPEWRTEYRPCTTHVMKPRVITKDVCRTVMVPVCCIDPCTGCPVTVCKPQTIVEQQHCTIHECVPVVTQVPVKVCHYRTEKQNFTQTFIHQEWKKEIVMKKEAYCVPVTYVTTCKVPVLVPCCH